ncbi:hypothetical protein Q667_04320 [Marinobacter sp. C1S70]|uniref:restriction endonuclease subunit S n=1 Tax=Marinobacter sp. C1S70 TaxID=1396859 RepID=UPI0003B92520|nr:restriction endonuclease subunit S [Marinobacter sp. C1S70]ERS83018.1 hypothetical protein Q667_04320 [Marinobacter sp. C1S70]
MSSKMASYRLGDLTDWLSGGTPSKKNPEYWGDDIPWISASSMGGSRYSHSDLKITKKGLDAGSRLALEGSILLLVRGSTLHNRIPVGIAERDVAFNQDVKAIRVKPELIAREVTDEMYVYYWLKANEQRLLEMVEHTGIGAGKLDTKRLQNLEIHLPPWPEQRQIVASATAIDEKEILNSRINQTLEQMAQAIFKSWFVDFEPVKAKIAALEAGGSEEDALLAAMQAISGKGEAELTTLQAEQPEQYAELRATAELFPSAMQDSELGEIPEGWIYGTLSDLADFSSNRISKDELSLETYISTENMLENRKGVCTASSLPSSASVPSFESGEILISNIRPYFKKIWLANKSGGRSPDVLGFTCRHKGTNEYLFNLLYQDDFFEYMMLTSKGAKMPRGDKKAIMQFGSVIPPIGLMKYFSERVKPFYVLATSQTRESESLESLRDTLLPKLLSGELSVSNIEDQLAELEEPAHV